MNVKSRILAILIPLVLLQPLSACQEQRATETPTDAITAVKSNLKVFPNLVDFGIMTEGSLKKITVDLEIDSIPNGNHLSIEDPFSSQQRLVKVEFPGLVDGRRAQCKDEQFGSAYLTCKMNFILDLKKPGSPVAGEGVIKLLAALMTPARNNNPETEIGHFYFEVPYEWGAPAQTTVPETVAINTTIPVPINTTETTIAKVNTTKTTTVPTNTTNPLPNSSTVPINTTNPIPNTSTVTSSTAAPTTVPATTPAAPPAIVVSPSEYDFGSVLYSTAPHDFVVTNTGGGTLRFTSFSAFRDRFFYTIRNTCQGAELSAGQSCFVSIQVSSGGPDISPPPGDHADTMNIVSNGGNASISLRFTTPG